MGSNSDSRQRILVIDDEEVIHASMTRVLTGAGYEVQSCYTAREGLDEMAAQRFDLVITDLIMPEMNGIAFLEALQERSMTAATIMVTGYPTIRTALKALRLGAIDYVAKPFTRKELLAPVHRALCSHVAEPSEGTPVRRSAEGTSLLPGSVLFLPNHSWAKLDQTGLFMIGVEESFLRAIGSVTEISTPARDELVEQGIASIYLTNACGERHGVAIPLTGMVEKLNDEALAPQAKLESNTWLVQLRPSNLQDELGNLVLRDDPSC